MCLIAIAYKAHPHYPLIVAANRDEFRQRPTERAHFWPDAPEILAGRDLRAGGTWLGITRKGRFAAITNYRDMRRTQPDGPSRGALVRDALEHDIDPGTTGEYAGFNLLYGTVDSLRYHNNIDGRDEAVTPGIHGLSNAFLDTPWPKVVSAKQRMEALPDLPENELMKGLFDLLADDAKAPDDLLPDTGLPLELERSVSSIFIQSEGYGTRCSTVLLVDHVGNVYFEEREVPSGDPVVERFLTR